MALVTIWGHKLAVLRFSDLFWTGYLEIKRWIAREAALGAENG
jgi:hypothetical protein